MLALFGLADVNPRRIKVAVPRRARPTLPPTIELTQVTGNARTVFYEGLAAQPVADAILKCRGRIENTRLLEAAKRARAEGLLTTAEWKRGPGRPSSSRGSRGRDLDFHCACYRHQRTPVARREVPVQGQHGVGVGGRVRGRQHERILPPVGTRGSR